MTEHPQTYEHKNPNEAAQSLMADGAELFRRETGHPPGTVKDWLACIAAARKANKTNNANLRRDTYTQGDKATRKANRDALNRYMAGANAGLDRFEAEIRKIAELSADRQAASLTALWEGWARPTYELRGKVPGTAIGAPDWQTVGGLVKASSEPIAMRLEESLERGQFHSSIHGDWPLADISGGIGKAQVKAQAEIQPSAADLATGRDPRELMREVAERLGDPRYGIGPTSGKVQQALMALWMQRRRENGMASIAISDLADMLYERRADGSYGADAYESIREAVRMIDRLHLNASMPVALPGGKSESTRMTGAGFSITYYADDDGGTSRAENNWLAIQYTPGPLLQAAITRDGAYLMGADKAVNKLHPVRQRAELLLAKYLERHWRNNWNKAAGTLTRKVRTLLSDGISLTDDEIERPSIKTWDKLQDALDNLKQSGTVRYWQPGDAFAEIMERGQRMTRSRWAALLEVPIAIEASPRYHAHYKNHGLITREGQELHPSAIALRRHLEETHTPQQVLAERLGISPPYLSQVLNGKRKVSPELADKIDAVIGASLTLALPFD